LSEGEPYASPLHAEVLTRLRDYIAEGHIADGARVPERQLCEMFGVSRTPLREAVKVLAAEGIVDLLPNRGARVRRLDAHGVRELFDMMAAFEALAGRLACENILGEEIAAIEQVHHEMYGHYIRQDLSAYFSCNQQIHEMILASARNDTLSASYTSLGGRLRRVRFSANRARSRARWSEAMREHEAMLEALKQRDGAGLSEILFTHLRYKRDAAVDFLRESGALDDGDEA
jgi:DNA-binding GntR family transcriptional regulator